jgi:hypothetical protein
MQGILHKKGKVEFYEHGEFDGNTWVPFEVTYFEIYRTASGVWHTARNNVHYVDKYYNHGKIDTDRVFDYLEKTREIILSGVNFDASNYLFSKNILVKKEYFQSNGAVRFREVSC